MLKEDIEKLNYKTKGRRYFCKCDCGTIRSVSKSSLIRGVSQSCGCAYNPPKNLDGKKFGKLTVVESLYNYNNSGRTAYRCICECGNETIVKGESIYKTKTCGCYKYDKAYSSVGKKYGFLTIDSVEFIDGKTIAHCTCDCGGKTSARLDQIKSGNTRSCGCAKSRDLTNERFGRLTVIREVESNIKQRKWLCKCDCGTETIVTAHRLISGHTKSCGCLRSEKVSTWELFIAEKLQSFGIKFEKEYPFDDCRNIYPLRFDFYIPSVNTCIEYDGEQHYRPVEYFGGEEAFKQRIINDNIKTQYCKDNNIRLVRISSKSKDEIEETLLNIIQNPVTTTVA